MLLLVVLGLPALIAPQLRRTQRRLLLTGLVMATAIMFVLRAAAPGTLSPLLEQELHPAVPATQTPLTGRLSLLESLVLLLRGLPHHLRVLLGDALGALLLFRFISSLRAVARLGAGPELLPRLKQLCFDAVRWLPAVRSRLAQERMKLEEELERDLKRRSRRLGQAEFSSLPRKGLDGEAVLGILRTEAARDEANWSEGRVSGTVYLGRRQHTELLNAAFGLYSLANSLHPETWPSGMRMEAEVRSSHRSTILLSFPWQVIAMTAGLVRGSCGTVCGATTSGGTESIILAVKAHRDYFRDRHGITEPEILCAVSAHAAVDKVEIRRG